MVTASWISRREEVTHHHQVHLQSPHLNLLPVHQILFRIPVVRRDRQRNRGKRRNLRNASVNLRNIKRVNIANKRTFSQRLLFEVYHQLVIILLWEHLQICYPMRVFQIFNEVLILYVWLHPHQYQWYVMQHGKISRSYDVRLR